MTNKLAVIGDNLDVFKLGDVLVKSGYFSDAGDAAKAVVKILAGQELGIGPVTAMKELNIIKGKISLSAALVAARIKQSGRYDYRIKTIDAEKCVIEFFEARQSVGFSEFSMKDAQAANLLNNETYKKFPRNMLFSRALTNGARWYCADVFNGAIYTPDELGEAMPEPSGDIVEQAKAEPQAALQSGESQKQEQASAKSEQQRWTEFCKEQNFGAAHIESAMGTRSVAGWMRQHNATLDDAINHMITWRMDNTKSTADAGK